MKQIDRYTLLEQFHKEPYQTIYMAINKEKEHEIGLVNLIDRNGPLTEDNFQQLVRHLHNVAFYDSSDQFKLITLFNEGMPLGSFLKNMRPSDETRLQLLSDILKGFSDYDPLPVRFKCALMDSHQLVVNQNQVFMNEVIFLKHLVETDDFHRKIKEVADMLLIGVNSPIAKHIQAFFRSTAFMQIPTIKSIHHQCLRLLDGDTMVLVDAVSGTTEPMFIAVDPRPILENDYSGDNQIDNYTLDNIAASGFSTNYQEIPQKQFTSEPMLPNASPEITNPVIVESSISKVEVPNENIAGDIQNHQKSHVHIGLTEKRESDRGPKDTQIRRSWLPWLNLLIIPIILIASWYVFLKEETPNKPFASYQVIASKSGWTLQSNAIAYSPATITKYHWKIIFDGEIISESNASEFSFKPSKTGDYQVILTVTDNYQQISSPFINVLHFDGSFELTPDNPNTDGVKIDDLLGGVPPSTTIGEIVKDTVNFHSAPNSSRLFPSANQKYEVALLSNLFVSKGDVMSVWIKTSQLEPVRLQLIGIKMGKQVYTYEWTFTPATNDFEKVTHTFNAHGLDSLVLNMETTNEYVWFDSFVTETIK